MQTLGYVRVADQVPAGTALQPQKLRLDAMLGTWHATDHDAGGIVRLVLAERDGQLLARAFGAGAAGPHDWGEVPAVAYGSGITATTAMAFSAFYEFPFLNSLLAAYAKQGILVLDTFTTFTDDSGRANYFSREFFHR